MKIKIISEGTDTTIKVINAQTGETIERITEATWHCKLNGAATVELEIMNVDVEIIGKKRDSGWPIESQRW